MIPTRASIGAYQLLEVLGQGGMGVVYHARHQQSGQDVALKTVTLAQDSLLESIRREIYVLRRVRHPGVVQVVDSGIEAGLPWYAMELLQGQTLRRALEEELAIAHESALTQRVSGPRAAAAFLLDGSMTLNRTTLSRTSFGPPPLKQERYRPQPKRTAPLTPEKLTYYLTVVRHLCDALAYLHGEGIVHRDLKPENILVPPNRPPIILDFGLITLFRGENNRDAVMLDAQQAGSANYMAPEQISEETLDARADLYALGCVLYELLTGVAPFYHPTPFTVTYNHLFRECTPPSELVVGIPPALDELVCRLLAKRPTNRLGYASDVALALEALGAQHSSGRQPSPRAYLYRAHFVGRERPLQQLQKHIEQLQSRHGDVVFVGGESGIGKSRLVTEAGRLAAKEDVEVITGRCLNTGGGPLEGLRPLLIRMADRCRERGPEETQRLLGDHVGLLALYELSLKTVPGAEQYAAPSELSPDATRLRLCNALLESLQRLAEENPVMVVLDDLQWADPLILDFLDFLLKRKSLLRSPVLLVGTWRSEECPPRLRVLIDSKKAPLVTLGRLEEPELSELIGDMLGNPDLPPQFASYLMRQSNGNPFFVQEYLHAMLERQLLGRNQVGRWEVKGATDKRGVPRYEQLPLPGSLRSLMEGRLAILPALSIPVLQAASVAGRVFSASLLRSLLPIDEATFYAALQELRRAHVLEELRDHRYRFCHDKLREVTYGRLDATQRQQLHARVAEQLERRYPEAFTRGADVLGMHWERGGQPERARRCYKAAADDAAARFALDSAVRNLHAYFRLASDVTAEDVRIRIRLGGYLSRLSRRTEAEEQYRRALEDAQKLNNPLLVGQCLVSIAGTAWQHGRLDEAEVLNHQAIELARGASPPYLVTAYNSLALITMDRGNREEARRLFQLALHHVEESETRSELGSILGNLAALSHGENKLEEARLFYQQTLEVARENGEVRIEATALVNLGIFHLEMGELRAAEHSLQRALELHRKMGDRLSQGMTLTVLATVQRLVHNNLLQAETLVRSSLTLLTEASSPQVLLYACCELGHISLAQGIMPEESQREAENIFARFKLGEDTEYYRQLRELQQATAHFARGGALFRGSLKSNLPEGLRRALGVALTPEIQLSEGTLL